jgi:hypothetical protein
VVNSQLAEGGSAVVTMRSLDPSVLDVRGATSQTIQIAEWSAEVRFSAVAKGIDPRASRAPLARRDRCVEEVPVEILRRRRPSRRRRGAPSAKETIAMLPVPCQGLADCIELSSTAMVVC